MTSFAYLLFLIPAAFIVLGALVGGGSKSLFFRWSGAAILAGGGLVLALSSLVKGVVPWAMRVGPAYSSPHWSPWQEILADHAGGLALVISRHFMSPVITVAGAVCVVGLLLFAFSFTFTRESGLGPGRPAAAGVLKNPAPRKAPRERSAKNRAGGRVDNHHASAIVGSKRGKNEQIHP